MSLDVKLTAVRPTAVWDGNITHNLGVMAREAGLYYPLWRPEEMNPPVTTAKHMIPHLAEGLVRLESDPKHFRKFNPPNGWGSYEGLVQLVRAYLEACRGNPDATIEVSR